MAGWKQDWTPMIRERIVEDWTWSQAEQFVVHDFQNSQSRPKIWDSLCQLRADFQKAGHSGYFLIDGSFVTFKTSPADVDVVVVVKLVPGSSISAVLENVASKSYPLIDSFVTFERASVPDFQTRHWIDWFTKDRQGIGKGLVRLYP